MYSHPIKKLFGLLVLYTLLIVGIFVLQFRSESVFSDSIGFLRFTLAKAENEKTAANASEVFLRNTLQADFEGLTIYFDENNPATARLAGSNSDENLTLISWNKASPTECSFSFSEGVSLLFSISSLDSDADLLIQANFPNSISSISLHYKTSRGYNITNVNQSQIQIADKKKKNILNAASLSDNTLVLSNGHSLASYAALKETKGFSFEMSSSLALANPDTLAQNITKMENNIISLFNNAVQTNTLLTEQSVVSYVAIMAQKGQYNVALDSVPDSFKRSLKRTYLSAPYFNTLEQMNTTLQMEISNTNKLITQAISSGTCDIFTLSRLSSFIILNKDSQDVQKLLNLPASLAPEATTPSIALGIIRTYTTLSEKYPDLAAPLQTVINSCVTSIAQACSLREGGKKLSLSDNGVPLNIVHGLDAGDTLMQFGAFTKDQNLVNTGLALLNSYFDDISTSDLYSYTEAYTCVVHGNPYYPHFTLLSDKTSENVWAWTCAANIAYENKNNETTIAVTFPQGLTHYIIIGGIPEFNEIQIYGINFRTDPRFETYNSSGYVHLNDSNTLLLKSRHKTEVEEVKLFYGTDTEAETTNEFSETNEKGDSVETEPPSVNQNTSIF